MSDREPRSTSEWVTLGGSAAILLSVVSILVVEIVRADDPASPVAEVVDPPSVVDGHHHVVVEVTTHGDVTASDVQVDAELVLDGEPTEATHTVDFLAGGETAELVFVFQDDPADGSLTVRVSGFRTG